MKVYLTQNSIPQCILLPREILDVRLNPVSFQLHILRVYSFQLDSLANMEK